MGELTCILGGVKSGKSSYAVELGRQVFGKVAFLATAQALDQEMKQRIERHKQDRPGTWITWEEPLAIAKVVAANADQVNFIIIDCLTLWLTNLLGQGKTEPEIMVLVDEMLTTIASSQADVAIVSNELGLGIVPQAQLAREFRDISGRVNQKIAAVASSVIFMVAGLPLPLKGDNS
jgi:adenosylcobinamide kinase / adenosylcobinamide-phosphate guanylyltransferase